MYGHVNEDAGLHTVEDAGSRWVTTKFRWSAVESLKGDYDWSSFDTKARNAQEAGVDLFVLFTSNPSWAAALPGGPVTDTQDLANISTQMAKRYDCDGTNDAPGSPCVHYWSFYAEPDNGDLGRALGGKGYWGHNGAGFAEMLSYVSPAIHAASPRAQVLIGGVAYDWFEPGGPFVRSFLTDTLTVLNTYAGGAQAYIDAVAFHYYPIDVARWPTIREKAQEIQGIMDRHGVGDLPLICPEAGYWSSPKHGSSEQGQAQRLVQMYTRGLASGVEILSWHKVLDKAWAGSDDDKYAGDTTGLRRVDGSLKPAYFAYQVMTRELELTRYSGPFLHENIEGYVFQMPGGSDKTVLWAKTSVTRVSFPYHCLRRVDRDGNARNINDGSSDDLDGIQNGQVRLQLDPGEPVYIRSCH
jgi:hypothetical protein